MISYLLVEDTANTLLSNLMAALSATELEVLNEGYTAAQQSQQDRISTWIETVFEDEDFVCAAFHYRSNTLWKVPEYKEKALMILEQKRPDAAKKMEEVTCYPSSKTFFQKLLSARPINMLLSTSQQPNKLQKTAILFFGLAF